MSVENDIRNLHREIQQGITIMIPEKYKKVCLYASVMEENQASTGEMFFYYFPSGILKKNPINVYEIPKTFNLEEEQYAKMEKNLYNSIKKLKEYCINQGQRPWSNLTITMEGTKYFVEYNYDDLIDSEFNNYSRHIIWRYKYLNIPIESYTKKEREIIENYFESYEYRNSETEVYQENIYEKPINKVTIYDSVENHDTYIKKSVMSELKSQAKNQIVAVDDNTDSNKDYVKKNIIQKNVVKNQLLNNIDNTKNKDNSIKKVDISKAKTRNKNQLLNF